MRISPKVTLCALGAAILAGCIPYQRPEHAQQSPISDFDGTAIVGTSEIFVGGDTNFVTHHDGVNVYMGASADGMTAGELIKYLREDIAQTDGVIRRFDRPPVVRIYNGANDEDIDAVVRAIQHINEALPDAWQLTVDALPDDSLFQSASSGEILVVFASLDEWDLCASSALTVGCTETSTRYYPAGEISHATIFIDRTRLPKHTVAATVAHELLHALGRGHAADKWFPDSRMIPYPPAAFHWRVIGNLDRDALLAVYGHLEAGDTISDLHTKLGAWENESLAVEGRFLFDEDWIGTGSPLLAPSEQLVTFGVADRNGRQTPWALGPVPWSPVEHSPLLAGSVTWSGRLLGMTPSAGVVAGAVELSIDLDRLDGMMDLTGLEQWSPRAEPGAIGTGTMWGDGDLAYGILVRDNSFIQDGYGDDGIVTGMFMGRMHEAMGGTLKRDDLKAAFGGVRD